MHTIEEQTKVWLFLVEAVTCLNARWRLPHCAALRSVDVRSPACVGTGIDIIFSYRMTVRPIMHDTLVRDRQMLRRKKTIAEQLF
jgi:hypothetical protein